MIGFMVNNAPGSYLIGAVLLSVGAGLLWHVTHEQRRARAARRYALALQRAAHPHPAERTRTRRPGPATSSHRPVRVIRPVVRGVAPVPRLAPDRTGALPGLDRAAELRPAVASVEAIPEQRAVNRG